MAPQNNSTILGEGQYLFVQKTSDGSLSVHVGPMYVQLDSTERAVKQSRRTGEFTEVSDINDAVRSMQQVRTSQYAALFNPQLDTDGAVKQPRIGCKNNYMPGQNQVGRAAIIQGPGTVIPWPGQTVWCYDGHILERNQYLLVEVMHPEEAAKNFNIPTTQPIKADDAAPPQAPVSLQPNQVMFEGKIIDLEIGKQFVISGELTQFYRPTTGFRVIPLSNDSMRTDPANRRAQRNDDEEETNEGKSYVRNGASPRDLEYCVLRNQSGAERVVRGPAVVFPQPFESFVEENGQIVFRALSLTPLQGLLVRTTRSWKDKDGITGTKDAEFKSDTEIFIRGPVTFYADPALEVVKYDGRTEHQAIVVHEGNGRYVMNRMNGAVRIAQGPDQLLLDPSKEIFVSRALPLKLVGLLYPGNADAAAYNTFLANEQRPAGLGGTDFESMPVASAALNSTQGYERSRSSASLGGSQISNERTTMRPKPREIKFGDSRFDGVPRITPYPGFAVCVVDSAGKKRIVRHGESYLLGWDETVIPMKFSTSTPKNHERTIDDAYINVTPMPMTEIITARSRDGIEVEFKVRFIRCFDEAQSDKWFNVENPIPQVSNWATTVLRDACHQEDAIDFHTSPESFVRAHLFGFNSSPGEDDGDRKITPHVFENNGFMVLDATLLSYRVMDSQIGEQLNTLLKGHALDNVTKAARVLTEHQVKEQEDHLTDLLQMKHAGLIARQELDYERTKRDVEIAGRLRDYRLEDARGANKRQYEADLESLGQEEAVVTARLDVVQSQDEIDKITFDDQERAKIADHDRELTRIEKFGAVFTPIFERFGETTLMIEMAKAGSTTALMTGMDPIGQLMAFAGDSKFAKAIKAKFGAAKDNLLEDKRP